MLNVQFINLSGIDANSIFITAYSDSAMPYDVQFKDDNGQKKTFNKKESQTLSTFLKNGLQINNIDAGRFYISVGKPWKKDRPSGQTPSAIDPTDDWFRTQWDKFEITMNNNNGDQANLTSIDFVGIPMRLETQDVNKNQIKEFGYPNGNKVVSKLADQNTSAVITDSGQLDGKIVRVNGPAQSGYPSTGGWPGLANYIAALKTANQSTQIKGEISVFVDADTNWRFQFDFQAVVNQQNGMTMTGTITANNTVVPKDQPASEPVFIKSDLLTITFDPDTKEGTYMSSFIYAGVGNTLNGKSNVNFTGNWESFFKKTVSILQVTTLITASTQFVAAVNAQNQEGITKSQTALSDAIQALKATEQNALTNVQKHVIGDLATGLAYGFLGSAQFKDKPSEDWFAEGQTLALSDLQPNNPFYSVFEKIVFDEAIEHRIYGHPYSDRLKAYEVAGNVVKSGNTTVDTLVITILEQENTTGLQKQKVDSIVSRLKEFFKSIFNF